MLKIGLTGGIASGKSTIAAMFEGLGAALIDTDQLSREVVEPGAPALAEIRAEFGGGVIGADGRLDRRALRRIVFGDAAARRRLESILHPRIRARVLERLGELERRNAPYAIVVVPLLVETGFASLVDRVLVVDCPVETQRRRLMARDEIGERDAGAMLDAQVDRRTRLAAADDVIDNGGSLVEAKRQVERLHARYLSPSKDVCRPNRGRAE